LQQYFSDISLESETLIKQKLETVVEIKRELQQILLLSIVFVVLFLVVIFRHISRNIIDPINFMYHVVQDVKDGNIRARFKSHTEKEDEIVQLGLSLNTMLETLEENNFKLLAYQQELEAKINELSTREREQDSCCEDTADRKNGSNRHPGRRCRPRPEQHPERCGQLP
jgi:methyl-accepting chemotaxis protein